MAILLILLLPTLLAMFAWYQVGVQGRRIDRLLELNERQQRRLEQEEELPEPVRQAPAEKMQWI